mgnify:CR=1 FL=1
MIKRALIFFIVNFIFSQFVFDFRSESNYMSREIELIEGGINSMDLLHTPYIEYNQNYYRIEILKNHKFSATPAMAIRYSRSGFEMDSTINNSKTWITPAIKFRSLIPIFYNNFPIGVSVISWFDFYKHSAYGLNEKIADNSLKVSAPESYNCEYSEVNTCDPPLKHSNYYFKYNPLYSNEFASRTKWPDTGIDF